MQVCLAVKLAAQRYCTCSTTLCTSGPGGEARQCSAWSSQHARLPLTLTKSYHVRHAVAACTEDTIAYPSNQINLQRQRTSSYVLEAPQEKFEVCHEDTLGIDGNSEDGQQASADLVSVFERGVC